MNIILNDNLALPVPYTLEMLGNGSFRASWKPEVPTKGLPAQIVATSKSSGKRALERLYNELVEAGVVYP